MRPRRRARALVRQSLSLSFTALAGEKPSVLDAAIWIVSPVAGLRPSRAALSLTLNLPKLLMETSSPLAAAVVIASNTSSTSLRASLGNAFGAGDPLGQIGIVHMMTVLMGRAV